MNKNAAVKKWGSRLIRFFGAIYVLAGVALRTEIATGHHWVGVVSMYMTVIVLGAVTIKAHYRLEELSLQQLLCGFLLLLIPQLILVAVMREPQSTFSIVLIVTVLGGLPLAGVIKYWAKLFGDIGAPPATKA